MSNEKSSSPMFQATSMMLDAMRDLKEKKITPQEANSIALLGKVGVIEELAFYADMQAISYINGYALITADKKEEFVKQFGHGMSVEGLVENKENEPVPYPDFKQVLPNPESIQHVSKTGAAFYPGRLGVLDTVIEAFGVSYAHPTVANKLRQRRRLGTHRHLSWHPRNGHAHQDGFRRRRCRAVRKRNRQVLREDETRPRRNEFRRRRKG